MNERDSTIEELKAFLLRAGESPSNASVLAETLTKAAEILTRLDMEHGIKWQTPRDRVRSWMQKARKA